MLGPALDDGNPGFGVARTNQVLFKNGGRGGEEADFGAKNTSASLPRRLRLLRRFLNWPFERAERSRVQEIVPLFLGDGPAQPFEHLQHVLPDLALLAKRLVAQQV